MMGKLMLPQHHIPPPGVPVFAAPTPAHLLGVLRSDTAQGTAQR